MLLVRATMAASRVPWRVCGPRPVLCRPRARGEGRPASADAGGDLARWGCAAVCHTRRGRAHVASVSHTTHRGLSQSVWRRGERVCVLCAETCTCPLVRLFAQLLALPLRSRLAAGVRRHTSPAGRQDSEWPLRCWLDLIVRQLRTPAPHRPGMDPWRATGEVDTWTELVQELRHERPLHRVRPSLLLSAAVLQSKPHPRTRLAPLALHRLTRPCRPHGAPATSFLPRLLPRNAALRVPQAQTSQVA